MADAGTAAGPWRHIVKVDPWARLRKCCQLVLTHQALEHGEGIESQDPGEVCS
jgi:hypothetical protein